MSRAARPKQTQLGRTAGASGRGARTWIQALRAHAGAVHDGLAPVQLVRVVQLLQALARGVIPAVNDPSAGRYYRWCGCWAQLWVLGALGAAACILLHRMPGAAAGCRSITMGAGRGRGA